MSRSIPARHAAANAHEHCEMVRERALALAELNRLHRCRDSNFCPDLARVHDIGKISGTAKPEANPCGSASQNTALHDQQFMNLVNITIRIFLGIKPQIEANRHPTRHGTRCSANLDLRLLCLFMVADRVDCPGGWQANAPLVWFLDQIKQRNLLDRELVIDDGPQ